ncbi:MAG: zinc carboxypeptidase, partial [Cyclobacteriaceae bacterium]
YYSSFDADDWDAIDDWVRSGGKLVLLQNAIDKWVGADKSSLKKFNSDYESTNEEERLKKQKDSDRTIPYAAVERYDLRNLIAGSIFKVKLDATHPLAYGYDESYFSLKTNNMRYDLLESGNVGYIDNDQSDRAGFTGQNVMELIDGSLVFGVESRGKGNVVFFIDNPLFRSFWYNGKLLFANAVFFKP